MADGCLFQTDVRVRLTPLACNFVELHFQFGESYGNGNEIGIVYVGNEFWPMVRVMALNVFFLKWFVFINYAVRDVW